MSEAPIDQKEIFRSISRYCDYQERCEQEVRLKLKRLGASTSEIEPIVDQLLDEDLINEERYAVNFTRGKFRIKNWGRIRIRAELKAKGITTTHIDNALDSLDPDSYIQCLHNLALRKLESVSSGTVQSKRKKLWDALIYRGWEKELVYDKIRELLP